MKPPLVIITGPNASGKSELAVRLARRFDGEIVSADSRQVYRGLDIGTGKITRRGMSGIPHHCLDIASPRRTVSVAEFQQRAERTIADILRRGRIPFLVGGTGFWVDAVAQGMTLPDVPPNPKLRKRLSRKSARNLLAILRRLDPRRPKTIEQKNPRRLIRAIEIAKALGRVPRLTRSYPYNILWIGVQRTPEEVRGRIRKRLAARFAAGMVGEARRLRERGLSWKRFHELGLEYRFLADYLRGRITRRECAARIERANNDYARRQMVWWKQRNELTWVRNEREAAAAIRQWLRQHRLSHEERNEFAKPAGKSEHRAERPPRTRRSGRG